jgi:anaerobic ribonucleoside-triphosphate reductase activating protein
VLRLARIADSTAAEGPGLRIALWLQGCERRCPGCCNPEMWPLDGGVAEPVEAVAARVERAARAGVEGLTLVGGEPFLQTQTAAAAIVAERARALGLGVLAFTGFELEALHALGDPGVDRLLAATDLLVDGPYDQLRRSARRRWIGSDNQRLHHFTDRYLGHPELADDSVQSVHVAFEDGAITVTGWPGLADALLQAGGLTRRGRE